jgi:hypothetical protein
MPNGTRSVLFVNTERRASCRKGRAKLQALCSHVVWPAHMRKFNLEGAAAATGQLKQEASCAVGRLHKRFFEAHATH